MHLGAADSIDLHGLAEVQDHALSTRILPCEALDESLVPFLYGGGFHIGGWILRCAALSQDPARDGIWSRGADRCAFFDLLPAAISAAGGSGSRRALVFPIAALGGLLIFDIGEAASRFSTSGTGSTVGRVSASLLIVHSTFDGTAIFAASTISLKMGLVVGLGVVAHDICDGLNTVLLSTRGQKPQWPDYAFLAVDALAPIAGWIDCCAPVCYFTGCGHVLPQFGGGLLSVHCNLQSAARRQANSSQINCSMSWARRFLARVVPDENAWSAPMTGGYKIRVFRVVESDFHPSKNGRQSESVPHHQAVNLKTMVILVAT